MPNLSDYKIDDFREILRDIDEEEELVYHPWVFQLISQRGDALLVEIGLRGADIEEISKLINKEIMEVFALGVLMGERKVLKQQEDKDLK